MDYMARALELARQALGTTSPNPAVGAVLVKDGRVIGEGHTQPPGGPHAEVVAIEQAGDAARGSTLYVTLEPCRHFGRTPPCTKAIIDAGIREVRFSHEDPDPHGRGQAARELREAGIDVHAGEGEAEARRINEAYIKQRLTGLPFVIAKWAMSLDGKIAATSGDSRWVSGPETREWSHRLRTQIDAIMVGVRTILVDDPQLTARPGGAVPTGRQVDSGRQPLRIVADSRGRMPVTARVLDGPGRALLATTEASSAVWRKQMTEAGAEVLVLPDVEGRVDVAALLRVLGERQTLSLLVEGGGELLGSFFDCGLVDKMHAVIAPLVIGGRDAPAAVAGRGVERMAEALRLRDVVVDRLGEDTLATGYVTADAA
ncbi:MAG: bifunctional diaminohydroxyphosphoribosylaminopyrimidine deaminase/5-amino-6-(5-phosphoribosylamino)uracil reductase RibD, partial [Dehalococcoidia bacterium]|nr:bifunctional diaminohydroxyphosphoribosylaminopyrimidine deaminase/5-amino-6-(5-phosphoribosylamino)uracil reductase RibD [Dehalococcoidia bacterium]